MSEWKQKRLQSMYNSAIKCGSMSAPGLCSLLHKARMSKANLMLFRPSSRDLVRMRRANEGDVFWASGVGWDDPKRFSTFTPLRQTILAFLIAMES